MNRMHGERVAKRRWTWRPEGTRPRRRPRKRWKDSVEDSLRRHELPTMQELMDGWILEDRGRWKRLLAPLTGR